MNTTEQTGAIPKAPTASGQSLGALQIDDALLRRSTVEQATGLSTASIYRLLSKQQFPQPVRLSTRCTRWRAGDIRAWLVAQAEARPEAAERTAKAA